MSIAPRPSHLLFFALCLCLPGCDSAGGDDDGTGGSTTICGHGYAGEAAASDFGEACTADSDCAHGTCLMPGDSGNITNEVFGFCTRGCDCDSGGSSASLSSEDTAYTCVYPGGCDVGTSQGSWRYAAPKCSDVSDCEAIDSRYTDCSTTDRKTVVEDTCGSLTKVCQAHAD